MPRKRSHKKTGRPVGRPAKVEVHLKTQHYISGNTYGPGTVSVDEGVAAVLYEQERNWNDYLAYKFLGPAQAGIIRGTAGGVMVQRVDPAHFDEILGAAMPDIRVSGGGR